ncbi:hypothetical protein [Pedococcus sp. 5OH_020]|uniref:hypothetical protein n=1 Tax=Pedococcus sp. 5OH_020 TaxID=2989814 RepID=UPI0022E9AD7E|nr:hypothetical protein [Pedococcus sp. 5OH_020]
MRGRAEADVRTLLSRSFRYRAYLKTAPFAYRHKVVKAFRRSSIADRLWRECTAEEIRTCTHDIYCDMMIRAYTGFTGLTVSPATGFAMTLFMIYIFTFDQEFERLRHRPESAEFEAVRGHRAVSDVWDGFVSYCQCLPNGAAVVALVEDRFRRYYQEFRRREEAASQLLDLPSTAALVDFDSGMVFETLHDILAIANQHEPTVSCRAQFRSVGLAGKFLDDLRDVGEDLRAGVPNLYHAATECHPLERQRLTAAASENPRLSLAWLESHCPRSHDEYVKLTLEHYSSLETPAFRLPLDLNWALVGSRRYWDKPIRRAPEPV